MEFQDNKDKKNTIPKIITYTSKGKCFNNSNIW